jgi:predicted P-loop ATPase
LTVSPATPIQVSKAPSLRSLKWGNHDLALQALLDWIGKLRVGDKSTGEVWAPATLRGSRRVATDVLGTHLAVFDSDAGHTLAELVARFEAVGWYARIIPSSSWGKDETEASADHYDAWVAEQSDKENLAERYLVEQLHKTHAVAAGAREVNRFIIETRSKQGSRGVKHLVRFRHNPCEKYRIVCVLSRRYDLSSPQSRRAWKKHYDAMIDVVGLPLDRSTGSPERLFYLSYLSPDRIAKARPHQATVEGGTIDVSTLPEPKPRERTRRGYRSFRDDTTVGRGADDEQHDYIWHDPVDGQEFDLRVMAAKGGLQHLELASALLDNSWPQDVRGVVDGKHHIQCPFEHEHTSAGDGGTIAWNASDYRRTGLTDLQPGSGITCNHNSCQRRDRLEFLLELLRKGGLTTANLLGASTAAKNKSIEEDFEEVDPDSVIMKPLIQPSMAWTRDQVCANASALRRLKKDARARFDQAARGWEALGVIDADELDLVVDVANDETDEPPTDPKDPKSRDKGGRDKRWRDKLQYGKDGTPLGTASNVTLALEHGLGLGGGGIAYNQLKDRLELRNPELLPWAKPGEEPRPWADNDDTEAAIALDQMLGLVIRPHNITPIVEAIGKRNSYHPVRDYLNGLVWDGVPRLDTLLTAHGGAEDNAFHRAATARTLIAAVARAMKPGCKVDTALLLESTQGFRKSTLFAALAVTPGWFTDNCGHLGERSSAEAVGGHWVVELAELTGLKKGDVNGVKAFISRQYDKYRPAYGRRVVDYPRQCILVGTVNGETAGYLRDLTGNRRFWIIRVGKIDWVWVDEWRDQLWAEAKHRYDAGEKWWLDDETEQHLIELQQAAASARTAEPELTDIVKRFVASKPGVSGHDQDNIEAWTPRAVPLTVIPSAVHYWNAVGKATRDIGFSHKVSFNAAMQAMGWELHQERKSTNPIGLARGSRFFISPEGSEAHKEGRLHEWLEAQARIGAVAGLTNPLEGLDNVIILEGRKRPKPKKDDDQKPAKPL